MPEYDNTNRGALFPQKDTAGNRPQYKGTLNVDGVDFDLAGWKQTSQKGTHYLSLTVQVPWKNRHQEAADEADRRADPVNEENSLDDELPF